MTYFYDSAFDIDQIQIFEYYRKGKMLSSKEVKSEDVAEVLLGEYDRPAPEDGFYIYDCINGELHRWRKYGDVITHWKPLETPCEQQR